LYGFAANGVLGRLVRLDERTQLIIEFIENLAGTIDGAPRSDLTRVRVVALFARIKTRESRCGPVLQGKPARRRSLQPPRCRNFPARGPCRCTDT
jgi:hypothetical protein